MKYFLAIIGGGPAGYTAAEMAARSGKQVVLFEQNSLGGTCLNIGCIPTKTLLYSAKQYHNALHADKYGVKAEGVTFDYAKIAQRKAKVVRKLVAGVKMRLKDVEVVNGAAILESYKAGEPWRITCGESSYEAENVLICTGSNNFVPPIDGIKDNPYIWDSTMALEAKELPGSVAIVGGGVIGMEFATLYYELGIPVTVIEAMPSILPNLDKDVVASLLENYRKKGINILTDTKVMSINGNTLTLAHSDSETSGSMSETLTAEKILVCVGRRANTQGLDAVVPQLEMNRSAIHVDDFMQTNLPGLYAAGDVTGKIMLAHVASRQAEVAVCHMLKQIPVQRIDYDAIPSVVYTNPEIAGIGKSEYQGEDLEAKILPMTFAGRFVAENEGDSGLCKLVINKKQIIVGVHMIGNPCSEFIAAASFAVRMGYTISEFKQVVFPHPTVSEILKEVL